MCNVQLVKVDESSQADDQQVKRLRCCGEQFSCL